MGSARPLKSTLEVLVRWMWNESGKRERVKSSDINVIWPNPDKIFTSKQGKVLNSHRFGCIHFCKSLLSRNCCTAGSGFILRSRRDGLKIFMGAVAPHLRKQSSSYKTRVTDHELIHKFYLEGVVFALFLFNKINPKVLLMLVPMQPSYTKEG